MTAYTITVNPTPTALLAYAESLGWPAAGPIEGPLKWRKAVAEMTSERVAAAMDWLAEREREADVLDEWNRRERRAKGAA